MDSLPDKGADVSAFTGTIWHAEALDLLGRLPDKSIDLVLCDLPYGNGITQNKWDIMIPLASLWEQLHRVVKVRSAIVLTAIQPFTSVLVMSNLKHYKHQWIWDKKFAGNFVVAEYQPMKIVEDILVFALDTVLYYPIMVNRELPIKGGGMQTTDNLKNAKMVALNKTYSQKYPTNILHFPRELGRTVHPTQKPVALFEYLIKTYTKEGEIVLDMCVGSGTTAVAARNLNRQFICGDITQEYVDMARLRLINTDPYQDTILPDGRKQLSLFSGEGE